MELMCISDLFRSRHCVKRFVLVTFFGNYRSLMVGSPILQTGTLRLRRQASQHGLAGSEQRLTETAGWPRAPLTSAPQPVHSAFSGAQTLRGHSQGRTAMGVTACHLGCEEGQMLFFN